MQWLENINQRMMFSLNRTKALKTKLNDIGWCLDFVYTTAIDVTKQMRNQEVLPEEIKRSLKICERKMESNLKTLSGFKFEIVRSDKEKAPYRSRYILFKAIKKV